MRHQHSKSRILSGDLFRRIILGLCFKPTHFFFRAFPIKKTIRHDVCSHRYRNRRRSSRCLLFLDGYGDVPFINPSASKTILERSLSDSTVTTSDKTVTIGRSENSATIAFDFANKTVHYSDLDLYASNHHKTSVLDLASDQGETDEGKKKYLATQNIEYYRTGNSLSFDLSHWSIPMYFENGAGYLPVQTFADLVLFERNIYLAFNGQNLFMSGSWSNDMDDLFYSAPTGDRSEDLAKFSYNELTLALDFQYGLKEDHDITDFTTYLPQVSGLKDRLLSTNALEADKGVYQLCSQAFSDFHSYLQATSSYAGKDALDSAKDATLRSPNFTEYQLIRYAFSTARTAVIKAISGGTKTAFDPYEEYSNGDGTTTAFVTFDNFTMPNQDYYTTPATASAADTYGILEYAHSQIFKSGSTVKNVVLDLSCNSGGSINASVYTLG